MTQTTTFNPKDRVSFAGLSGTVEYYRGSSMVDVLFDVVRDSSVDNYYNAIDISLLEKIYPPKQKFTDTDFPIGATFTDVNGIHTIRKIEFGSWQYKIQGGRWILMAFNRVREYVSWDEGWEYEVIPPQERSKIKYKDANWEI